MADPRESLIKRPFNRPPLIAGPIDRTQLRIRLGVHFISHSECKGSTGGLSVAATLGLPLGKHAFNLNP